MTRAALIRTGLPVAGGLCLLGLALAAWQWSERRALLRDLARFPAGAEAAAVLADAERLRVRCAEVEARCAAAGAGLAALEGRFAPAGAADRGRRRLDLLDLAARCALAVDEARLVAAAGDDPALAAWRRAYAADPARPPVLLRIAARGPFTGLVRFCASLSGLPWGAVPVLVEVRRPPAAGAPGPRRAGELRCDLVISL